MPYWMTRFSYWVRPYDMVADARVWWWQSGRACRENRRIGRLIAQRLQERGQWPLQ